MSDSDRPATNAAPRRSDSAWMRPVAVFVAVYLLGEWLLSFGGFSGLLEPLTIWTARITGAIAAATGVNTVVQGCNVLVPDRVLQVSVDCTGAFLFVAYAALVIAQPLSWRDRLLGIALGVPVLIAFNIGRLVLVAHVSQWMPNQFDLMHDFLFQGLMVLSALVVWLVWMSTVTRRAERTACV